MLKALTITSMLLMSGAAMAQSVGNSGNPAAANTTDPNSAPMAGSSGIRMDGRATTGRSSGNMGGGLDAAGRANTADPNSANSGGTNAAGRPANPMTQPMGR
jgi:hypothetical protein